MDASIGDPQRFGHFVLLEKIGEGGMGSVYKARDVSSDRVVGLKLLSRPPSAEVQEQTRMTSAVKHPHVVDVFSSGWEQGQFYIVMELLEHGTLETLMAEAGRIVESRGLEIGVQIAHALCAASEHGLIHRDAKPANILFADEHTAKIGDFGLAVAQEKTAEGHDELWGTPYYVAPERLNNEPEDIRSDIYGLGATLFHALTGQPPIDGETNIVGELIELKRQPRLVPPDVTKTTAQLISRMMAVDPQSRFQSYAELIAAMERARAASLRPKRRWW